MCIDSLVCGHTHVKIYEKTMIIINFYNICTIFLTTRQAHPPRSTPRPYKVILVHLKSNHRETHATRCMHSFSFPHDRLPSFVVVSWQKKLALSVVSCLWCWETMNQHGLVELPILEFSCRIISALLFIYYYNNLIQVVLTTLSSGNIMQSSIQIFSSNIMHSSGQKPILH
jgi:hypothetical protein